MRVGIKKKWIKALKSGEYKQGIEALRPTRRTYCCLGVLCDLYLKAKGKRWGRSVKKSYLSLPSEVMEWAGLESSDPTVSDNTPLSFLNDGKGKSFIEIAEEIKENL